MSLDFKNKYDVLDVCGEGGLATIYRVRNRVTGTIEAFKKLNNSAPDDIEALKREYRFLTLHRHPALPEAGGFWETSDGPGFIMEYIDGSPLSAHCGRLCVDRLESVFLQILEIAQFICHCGYIYADYKPANFLLMDNGQVRLIDFNLITRENETARSLSGTIQYLAPELLRGRPISAAVDIYSLGVCFHEIISGKLPFEGDNIDLLLKTITESAPPPLDTPDKNFRDAILTMMSRDPANRPSSPFAAASLFGWQEKLSSLIAVRAGAYLDSGYPVCDENPSTGNSAATGVLEKYLKKYFLPDDLQTVLLQLGKGNEAIARSYLKQMIDYGQLVYNDKGWTYIGGFDEMVMPAEAEKEHEKSLARLGREARKPLEWLAVADGPLKAEALAELMGADSAALEESLRLLMSENLVETVEDGFQITNRSLSIFMRTGITDDDRRAMHLRLAQYLECRSPESLDRIARQYFEAHSWGKAFEFSQKAAAAFFASFDLTKAQLHSAKSIQIMESGHMQDLSEESRVAALILAGDIAKAAADHVAAEKHYLEAAALCQNNRKESLALINKNLGDLYRIIQKTEKSLAHSDRALDYYRQSANRAMQAACLNNIGLACWNLGDYGRAESHFIEALEINRQLGNLVEQSKLHSNIGIIRDITGRKAEVLEQFQLALDCARKTDNLERQAVVLNNIGFFHLNSGNPRAALNYFLESRQIAHGSGLTQMELDIVSNIGWAYHELGDFMKSVDCNQETLDLAGRLNQGMAGARAALLMARDCLALGDFKLALRALQKAERFSHGLSNNELAADIVLAKIEFSWKTEPERSPSDLLEKISRFDKLTAYQNLQQRYWILKFDRDSEARTSIDKCEDLMLAAAAAKHDDLCLLAAIRMAELYVSIGEAGRALRVLENVQTSGAGITSRIAAELTFATVHLQLNEYDVALDRTARARALAEQSGCLPDLFVCNLVDAEVYRRCGKAKAFSKAMTSAGSLFRLLSAAYVTLSGRDSPVGFAGAARFAELSNNMIYDSCPTGLADSGSKENRPGRAVFIS